MFNYTKLFLEYLTVELGLSQNTVLAYERDLRLLQKALKLENDEQLAKVKRSQLLGYMSQLKAQGRSPATIARKLAAIKAFYRFLAAERYIKVDPAEVIEAAKKGLHLPKVLSVEEIENIIGIPAEDAPKISAKNGINIEAVLEQIVNIIPEPQGDENKPLKALIFDSYYDAYRGVVILVRVKDGGIKVGDTIIDDENYTVTYSNNINVGDATLTVTAKAKNKIISGSATVSFKIITSLASLTISTFEELKNAIQYGNNGNIEIDSTITIPAGETLTVPEGINIECGLNKIIVSGTLNNNGNIHADVNNKNSLLAAIEFANNITLQEDIVTDTAINIQPDVRDYNFILDLNGFNINNTLVISNYNGTSFNRKINIQLINNQSIFEDSTIGNASSDYGIEIKGNEDVTVNLSYVNVVGKTGIYYNSNFMGTNINLQNCSISSTNEAMLVEGSAVVFADNSTFNSSIKFNISSLKTSKISFFCSLVVSSFVSGLKNVAVT